MKTIHGLALSSKKVNLSEITKRVASTITMRVGFGTRYQNRHERMEILRQLTELQAMMANFFASDLWSGLPFVGWIDKLSGKSDQLEKCFQYFDLFYQHLIDEHAHPIKFSKCEENEEDFLDILLRLKKDHHLNLTYDHIKANLMVTIIHSLYWLNKIYLIYFSGLSS